MKRLLCIVGVMNAGGAETFLMKMYRQLDKSKYQMDFAVAVEEKGFYDDEIISLGGKIFHITPKSEGMIKNFISIKQIVKKNRYVYVLRTSQHSLSALELFAAQLGGAKVRIFRSSNSNTTTGNKKELLLHKLCAFMPRVFANVRIAPSTEAAEFMFGKKCIEKGKAFLLHNAVDLKVYHYDEKARIKYRREFNCENALVIGHVGRFNQQKNHFFLIEIFKEILQVKPNSKLVLIGTGELEEKIKKKVEDEHISDKVIFTGVRRNVQEILSAFDVFVFPSLYEGMPNTVIEAQATGVPCVISNTITREVDITGLVEFVDLSISARQWAEKIVTINLTHKDIRQDFVNNKYTIESVVEEFLNLLN